MALTRSIGAYDDGTVLVPGVGTTPLDTRKSLSALWASAGVVAGGPSPLVTGTAGFAYSVAGPVPLVTTRGPSDGFQMFTNDGAASVTCPTAPGSGLQRIDILWVRHPTNTENSDTSSMPIFGVASGAAVSSSPAAPSIPTGALELARNTMTSAATGTSGTGNNIAQTAATAMMRSTSAAAAVITWTASGDIYCTTGAQTVNAPVTLPAVSYNTRVFIQVEGIAGFASDATAVAVIISGSNAVTMGYMSSVPAGAALWATVTRSGWMDISANTTATISTYCGGPVPAHYSLNMTLTRVAS